MKPASAWAVAVALILISSAAQAAGVYRWVDEQGRVHYEDKNVVNSKRVTRTDMSKRQIPANPDWPPPPAFVTEVKLACASQQDRLKSYEQAGVILARDPGGNEAPLSERQYQLMLEQVRLEVKRLCSADAPQRLYAESRAGRSLGQP